MNQGPSQALVSQIRDIILVTFETTEEQAQEQAYALAALAAGWGGTEMKQHDWPKIVKKRFGGTLNWRRDDERSAFYSELNLVVSSYQRYMNQNRRA